MKRLFTLLLISFAALSCENVDEKLDDTSGKNDVIVFVEGTELTADVPSRQTVLNYKFASTLDWEVKTDAEWLEIDPMSGTAGEDIIIQVKVKKNESEQSRTAYVDLIVANNDNYRITINQAGEGDDVVVEIPNNQIWYTSTDGEIVEPHSGWYNNYADAHTTFGVNIVSNTYVDGKGVIEFDGDVTIIGQCAFYGCSNLTSVTIPDSVTTIGLGAFYGCSSLTSVTIPDSVTTIGEDAFYGCSSLTSLYITDLAAWCNISFHDDTSNPLGYAAIYDYTEGNLYLNNKLVADLTIPDSVTEIGDYAFCGCGSLTSVTIPDSVTTIGRSAFYKCVSIKNIVIPDSVTTIGDHAFAYCSSLTSATIPNSVTTLGVAVFRKCSSLTSITIPDSITTIGKSAFYECVSIKNIVIPNSVTSIGDFAFAYCRLLTSVNIPYSVVSIGDAAFKNCNNLRMFSGKFASDDGKSLIIDNTLNAFAIGCGAIEYAIPNGVNIIGNSVFCNCESLTSVTIPDSITTIGELVFYGCSSLTSVYCKPTTPPVGGSSMMFYNNASGREIYVPMESVEAYKSAYRWSDYADAIVGYNF